MKRAKPSDFLCLDFLIVNGDNYYQKKNKDKEEVEDTSKESILVSIPDTTTTIIEEKILW